MARRTVLGRLLGVWPSSPLAAALGVAAAACGAELDTPAEVDSLRILGVRKSAPYAAPGQNVELSMLWHDGTPVEEGEERPDIQRVWIGGCTNPIGDFYYTCAPDVLLTLASLRAAQAGLSEDELMLAAAGLAGVDSEAELVEALRNAPFDFEGELLPADEPLPEAFGQIGVGDRFTLPVPDGVVRPSLVGRTPYGVLFPFFAACAGTLHVSLDVLNQTVPLVCKDADGETLGADDFVLGYASVYVYDELRNRNPAIRGFEVAGVPTEVPASESGDVSDLGSPFLCVNDDCLVPDDPLEEGEACTRHLECASEYCVDGACAAESLEPVCYEDGGEIGNVPCIDPCPDDGDREKCDKIAVRPLLDEADNVELDPLSSIEGETYEEQMWVNYHVDRGNVANVVRLVNDSSKGWNSDYGTDLLAPKDGEKLFIWAVVRDNRGGTSWVRQTVFVNASQ